MLSPRADLERSKKMIMSALSGAALFLAILCAGSDASAADTCLSASCHADLIKGASVHAPVAAGECESCHIPTGIPHPGEGEGFRPVAEGGALCYGCHEDFSRRPRVHGPVKAGNCSVCHDPHAGAGPMLLRRAGGEACFACHGGIQRHVMGSAFAHPPVAEGRCGDCHDPHGSQHRPHLRAYYPREWYVAFSEENFALCFKCHDSKAFLYQRTSAATGFRNGDRNLHYLHVNKPDKGRVCRICHGVHGADQAKLVQSRTPGFGRWDIPVELTVTATGGTCLAGCHNPKTYDRVRPVRNP